MRKTFLLFPLLLIAQVALGASFFINKGIVTQSTVHTANDSLETFVASSNQVHIFEGATKDSVRFPSAENLPLDWVYEIFNDITPGNGVEAYDGSGAFIATVSSGRVGRFTLKDISSPAGDWKFHEDAVPTDIPQNFDDLYYRKTEHIDTSVGALDAGKPIVLNSGGLVDNSMLPSSATSAWGTAGNTGTNPPTDFIGTVDAQDFVLGTTNTERFRITAGGAYDTNLGAGFLQTDAGGLVTAENANDTLNALSPLTTLGDILSFDGTNHSRLPVCPDGEVYIGDSGDPSGWVCGVPGSADAITELTGDVTAIGPATANATIANDAVTNAKLANMAQSTIKGRASGAGTGDPQDLTSAQATEILDVFVGDSGAGGTKGLVPAPAAGDAAANRFLKSDGTWATAGSAGIGDVTGPGSSTDNAITRFDGTTGKIIQNSGATIDDSGNVTATSFTGTVATANIVGILQESQGGTGESTYSNGQILIGNGSGLTKSTITPGTGITITNGSGSITIGNTASGNVGSWTLDNTITVDSITASSSEIFTQLQNDTLCVNGRVIANGAPAASVIAVDLGSYVIDYSKLPANTATNAVPLAPHSYWLGFGSAGTPYSGNTGLMFADGSTTDKIYPGLSMPDGLKFNKNNGNAIVGTNGAFNFGFCVPVQ